MTYMATNHIDSHHICRLLVQSTHPMVKQSRSKTGPLMYVNEYDQKQSITLAVTDFVVCCCIPQILRLNRADPQRIAYVGKLIVTKSPQPQ